MRKRAFDVAETASQGALPSAGANHVQQKPQSQQKPGGGMKTPSPFAWPGQPSQTAKAIKPGNARRYAVDVTHHANQWASIATPEKLKQKVRAL